MRNDISDTYSPGVFLVLVEDQRSLLIQQHTVQLLPRPAEHVRCETLSDWLDHQLVPGRLWLMNSGP